MTPPQWFCEQLSNSMTGFVWAVECLAPEHWHSSPPRPNWFGQWSLARHVFHMQYQERYFLAASFFREESMGQKNLDMIWVNFISGPD
jgi:hypothetical protein